MLGVMQSPGISPSRQGTLWKWTNYLSGWQPRWFILDSGILSYYLGPSEVNQGCRGSLKVASCDIIVHPSDHQRMDIVMPGGRHIYLRAASTAERQQWLIALGSTKQGEASLEPTRSEQVRDESLKSKMAELHLNCQLLVTQISNIKSTVATAQPDVKTLSEMSTLVSTTCDAFLNVLAECMDLSFAGGSWPASLKPLPSAQGDTPDTKMAVKGGALPITRTMSNSFSEDELYPTTPSHSLPSPHHSLPVRSKRLFPSAHTPSGDPQLTASLPPHLTNKHRSGSGGNNKHVTFQGGAKLPGGDRIQPPLHTLASTQAGSPPENAVSDHPAQSPLVKDANAGARNGQDSVSESRSHDSPDHGDMDSSQVKLPGDASLAAPSLGSTSQTAPSLGPPPVSETDSTSSHRTNSRSSSDLFVTPVSTPQPSPPLSPVPEAKRARRIGDRIQHVQEPHQFETFFSRAPQKFEDLVLLEDSGIPTEEFLNCCRAVIPFFDTMNGTAFAPVKADINGNIEKLMKKFNEDPQVYVTLQAIVQHELDSGTHNEKNSATDALLWLKRAMEFVQLFILEVAGGEQSLDVAAGKAYSKSLRRFHNWIVRGIFSLAMKAVPYHKDFLGTLGSDNSPEGDNAIVQDMATFAQSLGEIVSILNGFYHHHKLDSPAEQ